MDSEYDIHHFSVDSIINSEVKTNEEQKEGAKEEIDDIEDSKYKVKFLTVDDSMTMRLIIKNTLLKNFKNIEVYEADDGYKCLDVLKENPDIDVIFMDWNMPNLNGADTVDKIREKDIYKHIKIIMATTEGAKDKVRQMISKGVKGYLVKPFKPETIVPLATKMIEIIKEERNV
ncbi:MAG TPA: response regulator [Campylobacterales bacterium]|nr:response regulator [Campylobacterales bacterium]